MSSSFYADEIEKQERFARLFLYGQEKSKKTWWAALAAATGFNVTFLDTDDGALIMRNVPKAIAARVGVINLTQTRDKIVSTKFLAQFLRPGNSFVWDLDAKCTVLGLRDPNHAHLVVDANKLTENDVIVLDSYSALVTDTKHEYAKEHKIDLADAERTDWDGYGYEGTFLSWIIKRLKTLPCHVIVIGHETVYEKRSKDQKTILSQTMQPISSSGPHAKTLGKDFTDILYFQRLSDAAFYINTGGDKDRIGGGRLMPPANYKWEDLLPAQFLEATGSKGDPTKKSEAFVYYPPGTIPDTVTNTPKVGLATTQSLTKPDAPKVLPATPASGSSLLASLAAKKTT